MTDKKTEKKPPMFHEIFNEDLLCEAQEVAQALTEMPFNNAISALVKSYSVSAGLDAPPPEPLDLVAWVDSVGYSSLEALVDRLERLADAAAEACGESDKRSGHVRVIRRLASKITNIMDMAARANMRSSRS